ncbi:penicillin-binding protein 1A [Prosthecomicrobium pneumaticum]|uniref:Penicillin-binding protein 1A n=1 Tax=Prosthecomicrobium pneumaticum TaxID=81895 RepID=A0A7W9FP23_9HYPH|nr:penicillin-binding protein 1A [Prosthecomicrobium pneumaticum]MBB5754158.1 penicillin-binding protein 1A [Prosthecomicrobium pneumaticum]
MVLRFFGYLFGIAAVFFLVLAAGISWYISGLTGGLPDYEVLAKYEPPVMTRIHAADGQLVAEFARERRLYLPIQAIPDRVKAAFISAEDKNFYSHSGLDYYGLARASLQNVQALLEGGRMIGASTITQQVAKNFLLTNERTIDRKIKEAILSLRIEQAYSKDKILELYLNEIFLGLGAYGVAAASLTYFDKSVHELTLQEAAYLAALPKGPNNYNPFRYPDRAIERRNWVIDRMVENGFATPDEGAAAKASPLGVKLRSTTPRLFAADYYVEEVRRQLLAMYGEEKLYDGGLSVRTSLDPAYQVMARQALMNGLVAFDQERGWRGPVTKVETGDDWGPALAKVSALSDVLEWRLAVVTGKTEDGLQIGLQPSRDGSGAVAADRETGIIPYGEMKWAAKKGKDAGLNVGDVVYVEAADGKPGAWRLRQVPDIEGALVAMDPHTGRVLALVGGFSFSESQFNRATQAMRQPGSSFKPFVYAAALDNGYTPSSVVMDAPFEYDPGFGQPIWRPENYSQKFYGPSTLRTGIELSRNVMTVRLAQDMGMPLVAEYARRFGIYDNLGPYLPNALGAQETTVLRLVSAYSVFANEGRQVRPTLIDRIQDRFGKTIFKHEERICEACNADRWENQDEPEIADHREQVLDPMTAYQITSMLEGVVQRGTGTAVKAVGKPIAGKTGTSNDEKDAWFVGYSPDLVVGVFIGYDQPKPMGRGMTGGEVSAPIFTEFMKMALSDKPPVEFRVPPGIQLIPIDRRTGLRAEAGKDGVILEAFKPGTGPPDSYSIIGYTDQNGQPLTVSPEADRAVMSGTGGLY